MTNKANNTKKSLSSTLKESTAARKSVLLKVDELLDRIDTKLLELSEIIEPTKDV